MAQNRKLNVAVVGLGFGAEFVPIYKEHPDIDTVSICDVSRDRLGRVARSFGIDRTFHDLSDILKSDPIDAVHLVSGIPDHARQAQLVLNSGKHCACTVPMATSLEDLHRLVDLQKRTGLNYMMMETAVYTRQFLHAVELRNNGALGRIQFLRGAHYQDMEGWPAYWSGLPPMWYATHAVAPLLALAESRALKVHCLGSGQMRDELRRTYGNPYPVESAIFQLETPSLCAEVTRSLYHCARHYLETFSVYGENACYEWQLEKEPPIIFSMTPVVPGQKRKEAVEAPEPPDRADLLPPSVGKFTRRFVYGEDKQHLSFTQGGGHHGSHPHLVHEFVRSVMEGRPPAIHARKAASWTAAGICAHASAMAGGAEVMVPDFS